jgi:lysophospholipase L1-like esterase
MLRNRKAIFLVFFLSTILIIFLYFYNRFSIATENTQSNSLEPINSSELTVGIIGDSWVAGGVMEDPLKRAFKRIHLDATVVSSGMGGAKTKQVYRKLFASEKDVFSSQFIKKMQVKYCIISCGVNDSFGQFGKRFYAKHMCLIVKELLKYNIKPVIIELPEYGVLELQEKLNIVNKIKNQVFAYFTSDSGIDNIEEYRTALNEELRKQLLRDKILFVDYDNICKDYSECKSLYTDHLHLTDKAYDLLCDEIASVIDFDYN